MTLALLALACGPRLGPPVVSYGTSQPLPLVSVSRDRRRWYVPLVADGKPWVMFVDTGYSYTTCDDDFVEALGLEPKGKVPVHGELGRISGSRVRLPSFELGGHTVSGLGCVVRDLNTSSSIQDPREVRVAGVLGIDVLRRFQSVFSPDEASFRLFAPEERPPVPRHGPGIVPLRREQGFGIRAVVPIELADTRYWTLVDTGATLSHVDGRRLALEPILRRQGVEVRGTGHSGVSRRDIVIYEVQDVLLAGHPLEPLRIAHRKRAFLPGLLGLNALQQVEQEYDFASRRARFTPTLRTRVPTYTDWRAQDEESPFVIPAR